MTSPLAFEKGALLQWNSNKLTDHNRSELDVDYNPIEVAKRMANGTMRKYVIADKRTFSVSWDDVPHKATYTVDGFWGGSEMEAFYNANRGPITLRITNGDGTFENILVFIQSFGKTVSKRGLFEFWNVSVEMEEV